MQAFEVDVLTKEPFLRLPAAHTNIILTPPRLSDAETIVDILNDPHVYPTLEGPPFPYEHRFAIEWLSKAKEDTDRVWERVQEAASDKKGLYEGSPVRIIRQVNQDGSQTFLGDCRISRWDYSDVEKGEERDRLVVENLNRQLGDAEIIWSIGGK
jgi:RimJ/RimL family protein N-acetyltransferase